MKKKYAHIDLPPELQAFRARFIAATEVEITMCGVTFYKMGGRHFARAQSSLTGKRVKKDKRFQRTMQHAAVLALAARYVTPIYNALTDDWRCHDLYRKLVGVGVKLLHQGNTKEAMQQEVYAELERLGYRTAWPVEELPPNLLQWLEEEQGSLQEASVENKPDSQAIIDNKITHLWVVNEKGKLIFTGSTCKEYDWCAVDIYRDSEVARRAGVG